MQQSNTDRIDSYVLMTYKSHTIAQQQAFLKCSISQVKQSRKRLIKQGLIHPKNSEWTELEDEELIDALRHGLPLHNLYRRELLAHRSIPAIYQRAQLLGGVQAIRNGEQAQATISAARPSRAIARLLGISYSLMEWLIKESHKDNPHRPFEYNRAGYTQPKKTRKPWIYWINDDALMSFLDNHHYWMLYSPDQITDPDWADYARQARADMNGEWYSIQQAAKIAQYSEQWIRQSVLSKSIKAIKVHGRWWIWSVLVARVHA